MTNPSEQSKWWKDILDECWDEGADAMSVFDSTHLYHRAIPAILAEHEKRVRKEVLEEDEL